MTRKIKIYVIIGFSLINTFLYNEANEIKNDFTQISMINRLDDCVGEGCW